MHKHLRHVCLLRPVALGVVLILNLTHPLFHALEGGMIDALLLHLDTWAMVTASSPID